MTSKFQRNKNEVLDKATEINGKAIPWIFPTTMLFFRFLLAILAQAIISGIFFLCGSTTPWNAAGPWWMVYGTLIDLGCLWILLVFTKKEGIRITDLIGYDPKRLGQDILTGLAYFLLFFVITMGFTVLAGFMLYGSFQPPSVAGKLPITAALYSVILWPLIWGIMEQITYQGYALPRMEKVVGRRWIAVLFVSFGWGLQHIALPLVLDWRFMAMRFISTFPLAIVMTILYLRKRRLMPFIVSHWAMDFAAAFAGVFWPSIMK